MSRLDDMLQSREDKLNAWKEQGINPYPQTTTRTHTSAAALEKDGLEVSIAGRIRSWRGHGKIQFADVHDAAGKIQVAFKADDFAEKEFANLSHFDVGDFIEVTGITFTTKAGERTVQAKHYRILSKAMLPLPDTWSGLKDVEERYRKRYLDLIMNEDVQRVFRQRSQIISTLRKVLDRYNFLEVETPSLQPLYGGANARPFKTTHKALGMELYLKISDELYLKRLIIGGMERVYEIDHNFRNEGIDRTHNPEFTMMECYATYWDYQDMMRLVEELYETIAKEVIGSTKIKWGEQEIELKAPWRRLTMKAAITEYLHVDVDQLTDEELIAEIKKHHLEYEQDPTTSGVGAGYIRGIAIATLFEAVEPYLIQPTFITDFPKETTALCKLHRDDSHLIERFEPYVLGWEVGNAYTELNDPKLQRQFFEEQVKAAESGDEEAHPLDGDFLTSMEYGMPPTGGLGLGIDRMVMIMTGQSSIRDVILFPTMRRDLSQEIEKNLQETIELERTRPLAEVQRVSPPQEAINLVNPDYKSTLPPRAEAQAFLEAHVKNEALRHHCEMVAQAMEAAAEREDKEDEKELWYQAGLLHDLDWEEFPSEHPNKAVAEWLTAYPTGLKDAILAHAPERTGKHPATLIERYLFAIDELSGLMHAYSLMRPTGFVGMEVNSVKKKLKDKAFAANVSREDISQGAELIGKPLEDHIAFLIQVFSP